MQRRSTELIALIVAIAALAISVGLVYKYLPSGTFAFALGLVAAIDTGVLGALLIFALQSPTLEVRVADDKWDGKSKWHFIHVLVRNSSWGFLGGGAAPDCKGEITVDGGTQKYVPKWVASSEPFHDYYLPNPPSYNIPNPPGYTVPNSPGYTYLVRLDPGLVEQAKLMTIGSDEERALDIAMKVQGDPMCYIHEPESYAEPDHKKNPYGPGSHSISLVLKHGSRTSGPYEFILENGSGTSPDSLILKTKPSRKRSHSKGASPDHPNPKRAGR